MDASGNIDLIDKLRSKTAAEISAFEAELQRARDKKTSAAKKQLRASTQALIRTLARVLILTE
jgi:hypothetical protein